MVDYTNTTQREFLYSDFDNDGAKNVDDPKPFDKKVSHYPTHKANPSFFHRAQYGDGEREVLMSKELQAIERYNNQARPQLDSFLRDNPGSSGRIKTVPSTIKKLRERGINNIFDVAGARILTNNRAEATKKFDNVKKKNPHDKGQTDDYYKKPKGGVHYAYHTYLTPKNKGVPGLEVQVTSKKMAGLQSTMHRHYKAGRGLGGFVPIALKLFKKGY